MSIQSIKIKIGDTIHEMTIEEAKALKEDLDALFPQRQLWTWPTPQKLDSPPRWYDTPLPLIPPISPHADPTNKPYPLKFDCANQASTDTASVLNR